MGWAKVVALAIELFTRWMLNRLETNKEKKEQRDEVNRELISAKTDRDATRITAARDRLRNLR